MSDEARMRIPTWKPPTSFRLALRSESRGNWSSPTAKERGVPPKPGHRLHARNRTSYERRESSEKDLRRSILYYFSLHDFAHTNMPQSQEIIPSDESDDMKEATPAVGTAPVASTLSLIANGRRKSGGGRRKKQFLVCEPAPAILTVP